MDLLPVRGSGAGADASTLPGVRAGHTVLKAGLESALPDCLKAFVTGYDASNEGHGLPFPDAQITDGLLRRFMRASNVYRKSPMQTMLYCLVCCGLLAGVVFGQADHPQRAIGRTFDKREVADAVARVKSGKFDGYHVGLIGEAGAIEAIPDLEKQFARATEPLDKAKLAQVLLLLGDKKDAYWDFLAELAKPALESGSPNPIQYDPEGKSMPGLSPEFIAWAKSHVQSPNEAGENAIYIYPGIVMLVGGTRDPRAIPLLRQALSSPNDLIENAAAKGLAEVQDTASVPLIIGACKKAPAEAASAIAESLVYFDDPQAQNAVDTYVPKEEARVLREARMMGKGALHR